MPSTPPEPETDTLILIERPILMNNDEPCGCCPRTGISHDVWLKRGPEILRYASLCTACVNEVRANLRKLLGKAA